MPSAALAEDLPTPSIRHGGIVMGRTLFALVLREARVRHGRSRIGYAWALIEPFAIVVMISLLFSGFLGGRRISYDLGIFYVLGVVNFQYFRHASHYIALALDANSPLFNYPSVHEFDAVLARLTLDTMTYIVITLLMIGFISVVFGATGPAHPQWMYLSFAGLGLLALGIGLNLAALQRRFQTTVQVWGLITAPLFFFSAILHSAAAVPTEYRTYLLWNPVVHGTEGFRSGWYPSYGEYVDLPYLYLCALITIATGLAHLLVTRRGTR